ncbi:hypothetical protein [Fusobacterium polymorphum]|uniref:hypothetical protein n=1 Tax=Fusobacterium nucleatum subsp. polymorphum TaxID=76857 RepID=UPI0030088CCE
MGFWDSLGKIAGEIVEKGVNDLKKTAGDLKNLRDEMESYSESELVSAYKNARRSGNYKVSSTAKRLLKENYDYEDWKIDDLDF